MQIIQFGRTIRKAWLITAEKNHAFLLAVDENELLGIKCGFASGYGGEGPRTLADALELLDFHGAEIEEIAVDRAVLERLDASALTVSDIDLVLSSEPILPIRWHEYVYDIYGVGDRAHNEWAVFPTVLPLALIDKRIRDLALAFPKNPDKALLDGFRRLEDLVREKTGINEHGAKLFNLSFQGPTSDLWWPQLTDPAEQVGRAQLFMGTFMAFRNPRAHRELDHDHKTLAQEFLLLNTLFCLTETAHKRVDSEATR